MLSRNHVSLKCRRLKRSMANEKFPEAYFLIKWAEMGSPPTTIDGQTLAGYSLIRGMVEGGLIDLDNPWNYKVSGHVLVAMSQSVGALSTTGVDANNRLAEKIQAAISRVQMDQSQTLARSRIKES
jgi:hypothetical protein